MASTLCCLCNENIPSFTILAHIPRCYRQICEQLKIVPVCTCNLCKGERTHEGDILGGHCSSSGVAKRKSESHSEKSNKRLDIEVEIAPQLGKIDTIRLQGKACIFCGTKKSASNAAFDYIHLGQYRKLMICKKSHLIEESKDNELSLTKFQVIIDEELALIKENGDSKTNMLMSGSQEEIHGEESIGINRDIKCCGFCNLENLEECTRMGSIYFYIDGSNGKKHFCKASHLVRYLVHHHCAHGKKKSKKIKKKDAKKTSKSSEDD
jgi:hypothetical protein